VVDPAGQNTPDVPHGCRVPLDAPGGHDIVYPGGHNNSAVALGQKYPAVQGAGACDPSGQNTPPGRRYCNANNHMMNQVLQ
jgi:hypothetical protein